MKRKQADRPHWQRILRRRFTVTRLDTPAFQGYVTLLRLIEVRQPLWVPFGARRLCVADHGYCWLQHFPEGAHYTLTTMLDAEGQVVQWYFDLCKAHGVDERGIPWYDDLYLDVIAVPSGEVELIDVADLDEARRQGLLTPADYDLAWREANHLLAAVRAGDLRLLALSAQYWEELRRLETVVES